MSQVSTPSTNGKPRRMLSDQLDRLDTVINDLEESLPAMVGMVVRDVLQDAVREMLRHPEFQRAVRTARQPAEPEHDAWTTLARAAQPLLAALLQTLASIRPHNPAAAGCGIPRCAR